MQHPSKPSVLVIEDDPLIQNLIADIFEYDPYELSQATTGAEGLAAYARLQPDLVICDIHLPDMLGLDICRVIKQRAPEQLFVFLTGAGGETDQVVGLEIGADDYIVKPLVSQVFRARIRALLRRLGPQEQPAAAAHQLKRFGSLTIDTTAYQAFLDEQELNLTHKEFELLWWLASHPGQLFTRQRLLDQIWQDNLEVNERSVDALIRRLREKLGEDGQQPRYIETIRGMGYRFKAE
ncbi:MAG: response regulator transcription factor [Candidatus Sericytochromatia bacterium]